MGGVVSLNIYDSEQHVHWGHEGDPAIYWGWEFSWSGWYARCFPFSSVAHRDAWTEYVGRHFGSKFSRWELRELACLLALAEWGDEHDREGAQESAHERFADSLGADSWECALELVAGFDPSTGEPRPSEVQP
jgi:hypothetical protein